MKKYFLAIALLVITAPFLFSQPDKTKYPDPEYSKEVYYLKKDSTMSVMRLEKGSSKMETKTKMGGMGGAESGYSMDGEKSTVRIIGGSNLSFVYSTGASARKSSPQADSIMRANGMDPAMMENMNTMMDPMNTISLYKAESGKNKRKVLMQKSPGAFGGKKSMSSDKITFSAKKIREGYWELVIDKPLSKGEYVFTMMDMSMGNMDGSSLMFAFGIDTP